MRHGPSNTESAENLSTLVHDSAVGVAAVRHNSVCYAQERLRKHFHLRMWLEAINWSGVCTCHRRAQQQQHFLHGIDTSEVYS